jgi:hypothetical protein
MTINKEEILDELDQRAGCWLEVSRSYSHHLHLLCLHLLSKTDILDEEEIHRLKMIGIIKFGKETKKEEKS